MYPTDYVKAVYIYATGTLVLHRADGDTYSRHFGTEAEAQHYLQATDLSYLLPIEVKSNTAWGLLKSIGSF